MNSPVEERLRDALNEAGATVDVSVLRPLTVPERRRFRVDLRLVVTASVVVLAGAAAAVFLTAPGDESVVAVAPAAVKEPAGVTVFLCKKGGTSCRESATAQQTKAIESLLKRQPGVQSVLYEDQVAAFERFRETYAHDKTIIKKAKVEDMPTSFRVGMKPGADPLPVATAVAAAPGAAMVTAIRGAEREPTHPDVWVRPCYAGADAPACAGLKDGLTEAQLRAFERTVKAMPEVKTVVSAVVVLDVDKVSSETFSLMLKPGADRKKVVEAIKRMRGMEWVQDGRCVGDLEAAKTQSVIC